MVPMTDQGHDLSGIQYQAGQDHSGDKIALVVSKWNDRITHTLRDGAIACLQQAGVSADQISVFDVPGSYELPAGAQAVLFENAEWDAVICLGCVIQGETRHFEFICQAVSKGIMDVGLRFNRPVIFGVLTPDTMQQALDRAGGKYGNKGEEAAVAALEMIDLFRKTGSLD